MTQPIEARARAWLFDRALPFWAAHGVDERHGGFIEELTLDGADAEIDFKRCRVTSRQIYVFSHAVLLGWMEGAPLIRRGVDYLTEKAWMGDDKGFARRLTRSGEVLDPTPDLYDHAFALFAFAWAHRATDGSHYLRWAHKTLDVIERAFRHPSGVGFYHCLPPAGPRQQNPHMHLFEAALAAFEASGEARFADLARELAALFADKFYNPESRTLAEFFEEDWSRATGEAGRRTEPGHHFEWSWILVQAKRLVGVDLSDAVRGLVAFAERYGVDPSSGAAYMAVRDDGAPIDRSARTWTSTERIKAAVALYDLDGVDPRPVFEQSGALLLDRYLAHDPAGTWIDAFDADGRPTAKTIPSSTFYHIFLAFAEMLRVRR